MIVALALLSLALAFEPVAPVVESGVLLDSGIRARLDVSRVDLGDVARLVIEVRGSGAADAEIDALPAIEGLSLEVESGPVTTFDPADGELTSRFVVAVRPLALGTYRIGGIKIVLRSDRSVLVADADLVVGGEASPRIECEIGSVTKSPFVGEVFAVDIALDRAPQPGAKLSLPWLDAVTRVDPPLVQDALDAIDVVGAREPIRVRLSAPQEGGTRRAGEIHVFASRPGRLEFAPSLLEFTEVGKPLVSVPARPSHVDVQPLPANAPPEFVDAVGDFSIRAALDHEEIGVGELFGLLVRIESRGDRATNLLRAMFTSLSEVDGFRVLGRADQRVARGGSGGSATGDVLSIRFDLAAPAVRDGVPPIRFAFFDPALRAYRVETTPRLPLRVTTPNAPPKSEPPADVEKNVLGTILIALLAAFCSAAAMAWYARFARRRAATSGSPLESAGARRTALRQARARLEEARDPLDLEVAREFARFVALKVERDVGTVFPAAPSRGEALATLEPAVHAAIERYFDAIERRYFAVASALADGAETTTAPLSREEFLALVRSIEVS